MRVRPLTDAEHRTIHRLAKSRTEPARLVERAQMVRRAARGEALGAIATALGCNVETVRLWGKRFNAQGLDGLHDRPRAGRPPTYTAEGAGTLLGCSPPR